MARPHRILFVCTGNICRSPMAEFLARAHADRTSVDVEVRSASTLGLKGRPAEERMIRVGKEVGLDLTPHRAQPVTAELLVWADHVWVMETAHHAHCVQLVPEANVRLLGRLVGVDEIADPINAWFLFRFRQCRKQLQTAVHQFLDGLPSEVDDDG